MTHNGQAAFRKFIKVVRVLTFLLVEIRWRLLSVGHHDDHSGVNSVYNKPDPENIYFVTFHSVNKKSFHRKTFCPNPAPPAQR